MQIYQFPYSQDNLAYLLVSNNQAMAIDPGAVEEIIRHAEKNKLTIKYVANTHSHYDHTGGNQTMLSRTKAEFIECKAIESDQYFYLGGEPIQIFPTPGHTMDCVCFTADDFIITGDTLFSGTIGNCFSGDLKSFFDSISRIIKFPGTTRILGGHDYVLAAMNAAQLIEPENPYIPDYLKAYNPSFVVSTLEQELQVNPYLRFNAPDMIKLLKHKNLPNTSAYLRFKSVMNHF